MQVRRVRSRRRGAWSTPLGSYAPTVLGRPRRPREAGRGITLGMGGLFGGEGGPNRVRELIALYRDASRTAPGNGSSTVLPRAAFARTSWKGFGAVILVGSLAEAPSIVDRLAPEHLEIATHEADVLAALINNAGAIFIGRYTPEVIGDYVAGTNHVLPSPKPRGHGLGRRASSRSRSMKRRSAATTPKWSMNARSPSSISWSATPLRSKAMTAALTRFTSRSRTTGLCLP